MPIYEYQCRTCGHKLEMIQKFSDPLLTDCPACGRPDLRKLVSAAGFQLKGSGWYASDAKTAKTGKAGKAGESASEAPAAPAAPDKPKSGGCCGGACGCAR